MSSTDRQSIEVGRYAREICAAVRQTFQVQLSSDVDRILTLELRRFGNLVEEIGSQIFIECAEENTAHQTITDDSFKRIVWRICKRSARESHRRIQQATNVMDHVCLSSMAASGSTLNSVVRLDVQAALEALEPHELLMIQLRVFDELPVSVIAAELGISPSSFDRRWKSLMHSLHRRLA